MKPFSQKVNTYLGFKQEIVSGLKIAIEEVMPDIMMDNELPVRCGYGQFTWNPIIKQLLDMCDHIGWIECSLVHRGAWPVPVLYHPNSGYLLTLMKEDRFRNIQREQEKVSAQGKHYLCGCADFNKDLDSYEQCNFELPECSKQKNSEWIAKTQKQFLDAIEANEQDVKGHILILFDTVYDKLTSVRAVRLTRDLEISEQVEDWSQLINTSCIEESFVEPQQNYEEEEEEELVTL